MAHKKTSLSDIATALGLSKSTVSFVLNGKGNQYNISSDTQKLIQDKARELNYVPNFFAKGLREGKTKTVGVVIADISNPFYGELCKVIQEELYGNGYNVFIVNTNDSPELEMELVQELINRSIDALILAPCNPIDNLRPALDSTPIPVVFMDRIGDVDGDFVGVDNVREAYDLVGKFSGKPARLAIFYPYSEGITTVAMRAKGAIQACEEASIPYELINVIGTEEDVQTLVQRAISNGADAILSLNNKTALSTLEALKNLHVLIPDEVRMIAFDDSEAFSYFYPPITALCQPVAEIGKNTVQQLMSRLSVEQKRGNHILLPCHFLERSSH